MTEPPVAQPIPSPPVPGAPAQIDPVLAGFDQLVAMAGYALLFVSVFMVGVPALAALALAYAHKGDTHLVARSHFRFQLRIFWTAILFLALGLGSVALAAGFGVGWIYQLVAHTHAFAGAVNAGRLSAWSGAIAGLLLVAAVLLTALAALWTLGASLFGFVRLISNKPIGHEAASA
jgi:uncharacterized membrane protein